MSPRSMKLLESVLGPFSQASSVGHARKNLRESGKSSSQFEPEMPGDQRPLSPEEMIERETMERSLYKFLRGAWPYVEPEAYVDGWIVGLLCEHFQAVSEGQISQLLINLPPRCTKTIAG